MRIVLFGTGARAAKVYEALAGYDVPRFVKDVRPWLDVNDESFLADMRNVEPDLFIVAGYPTIFKPALLAIPKHGAWNCHAGPVPEYRGGSPLNWQIIDGKANIGISLLKMDAGIDTGPVIDTGTFHLRPDETIREAHHLANGMFAAMVLDALRRFPPEMTPQPASDAYRRQRTDSDGMIDWGWDAKRIHDFVRALTHPYPGAWTICPDGKRVRIWQTTVDE